MYYDEINNDSNDPFSNFKNSRKYCTAELKNQKQALALMPSSTHIIKKVTLFSSKPLSALANIISN
jgi:hypothetical protein